MKASKAISTVGIGAAIVVGSMLAVTAAGAHNSGTKDDRIADFSQHFNLDETEVKAYFEEKKAEHKAEHEAKRAEHLAGLVESSVLTQAQADEMVALREGFREEVKALKESGASREEIKAKMAENKEAFQAWADEQGINLEDVRPEKGEGFGKHKRGFRGL